MAPGATGHSHAKVDSPSREALHPQRRLLDKPHFTVAFEKGGHLPAWTQMRAILEYAYQEISVKFGFVPDAPIRVVVHATDDFAGDTGSPAWADTLFDQASGTIHIPAEHALDDLGRFSRVVRHELVHALLYARMKAQLGVVPTWLVEGLAIGLAEDSWPDVDESRKRRLPVIPLASLQGQWKDIPVGSLPSAYLEAELATRMLIERFGIYGVRQVLNVMRTGQSLDSAMETKLSLSYDNFHKRWMDRMDPNAVSDLS